MKILVSDKIDDSALDLLQNRGFDLEVQINAQLPVLGQAVRNADGWIIRNDTRITARLLQDASRLRVIGRAGVGVDKIDVQEATRLGIAVLNTPAGNTVATVEHTLAMLFALCRKIPAAHHSLAVQKSRERMAFTGVELSGKTMGVIGLGRIGSRVALHCLALGMTVVFHDPYLPRERAREMGLEQADTLESLLQKCDFISLHVPLTEETASFINAERLAQCKSGVRIVNCAGDGLIDEAGLHQALLSEHVAGAALDMPARESLIDSPLLDLPNLIATPHLAANTRESQVNVGLQVAEQVADALEFRVFREAVNMPVRDWDTFNRISPKLKLVEMMGQFAQKFTGRSISKVSVEYCGAEFEEIEAINNTLLTGLLNATTTSKVNPVNAAIRAAERGMSVSFRHGQNSGNYRSLVRLTVETSRKTHNFAGTTFSDGEPRLVEIDNSEVELFLYGVILVFCNYDKPGVVGNVGTVLGENEVNIAHFSLGRESPGGLALGIVATDNPLSRRVMRELRELPDMQWVKQIRLS